MFALKISTNKHSIGTKSTPRFNGKLVFNLYSIVILKNKLYRFYAVN